VLGIFHEWACFGEAGSSIESSFEELSFGRINVGNREWEMGMRYDDLRKLTESKLLRNI
jgi:hypothetical protein